MDYIETLLKMEDDLDETEDLGQFGESSHQESDERPESSEPLSTGDGSQNPDPVGSAPDWCVCGNCHPMPQEIETKCCKLKKCITLSSRFTKLCLDPDVLELCIKKASDIRNDREDSSTRAFRKAAYRQFMKNTFITLSASSWRQELLQCQKCLTMCCDQSLTFFIFLGLPNYGIMH